MQAVTVPLVSFVRTEGDEKHTRLTYYVGETVLLEMDILKEFVPPTGPVDELTLVQLLVTPHEHMAVLGDVLAFAKANKTTGPEWENVLARIERLLLPPG